jgi:hypothetical protein
MTRGQNILKAIDLQNGIRGSVLFEMPSLDMNIA